MNMKNINMALQHELFLIFDQVMGKVKFEVKVIQGQIRKKFCKLATYRKFSKKFQPSRSFHFLFIQ